MPNQEESPTGKPTKDRERPSPDVERHSTDGQSNARGRGASDEQGRQDDRGEGPGKVGELGAPSAGMSDRVGPSDPDAKRDRNGRNQ